jgi:uncharacterized protein YlxW (UPF0749 family)
MRRRNAQLAITIVTAVLGFLVVLQIRSQAGSSDLANRSAQDLTQLVANLNTRNDQLRGEVATLQRELGDLQSAQARGDSSIGAVRADLARVRAWAGLDAVTGAGIRIGVQGPITAQGVEDLLNELRNAGAEAITVGGLRVVTGSVVDGVSGGLSLEGHGLADPLEIDAIGSAEVLTGTLTRAGGIIAQLSATQPDVVVQVTPVDRVDLPATARDLTPAHATPRL